MIVFENIEKAIAAINEVSLVKGFPKYYRGQRRDYHITSSLHRLVSDEEIRTAAVKTDGFIQWMKSRDTLLPSVSATNASLYGTDLIYWAIAQHYGYKTDLIDFSTSIKTAKAFALLGRQPGETGVIYCLWEEDVQDLIALYRIAFKSLDEKSKALLESVNYNPFFTFQIEELSRINNQQGLFLWDLNAIITTYWNQTVMNDSDWVEAHCFYFYQTEENIDISLLRTVYPEPNRVELIIDQYVQVENHNFFYKNYGEIYNSIEKVTPLPTNTLLNYFEENDFSILNRVFNHENSTFYPREGMEILTVDIDYSFISRLEDESESLRFVESWLQMLGNNKYQIISSSDPILKLYSELINEVLALHGVYPSLPPVVLGIILVKVISIVGSLILLAANNEPLGYKKVYEMLTQYQFDLNDSNCSIDTILDVMRNLVCLNDLAADVWGCECVFLTIIGSNNTTSHGVIPLQYINDLSKDYKKHQLETIHYLYEQGLLPATRIAVQPSGEIYRVAADKEMLCIKDLFNYVSKPDVLFDDRDMFLVTIHCFIPWQIVMCPKRSRLYNPSEYKEIRLMEKENMPNARLYYWDGAYITLMYKPE